jgi:sulfate adenylyltransferase subunit 1 (EFTu-like GTPase family)
MPWSVRDYITADTEVSMTYTRKVVTAASTLVLLATLHGSSRG